MNKYKALLIGCGNIGALYDYDNEQVQTHAKAYVLNKSFSLSVYDVDLSLSKKISEKYNAELIDDLKQVDFSNYDCISICSPTDTHFPLLEKALKSNVKIVICEKPVSYSVDELKKLDILRKESRTVVIVNYIRRFQPAYIDLKSKIKELLSVTTLSSILIKYQKGFINNCSHALDLLEYLFDKKVELELIKKSDVNFDFFKNDPTLSISALWDKTPLNIAGMTNINYSVFEIELCFREVRILITESGQKINIYHPQNKSFSLPLSLSVSSNKENCLDNYMIPVVSSVEKHLNGEKILNNFSEAISLNIKMLEILSI